MISPCSIPVRFSSANVCVQSVSPDRIAMSELTNATMRTKSAARVSVASPLKM